jgi:Ca2+-binding EF-hand superfamily protein
MDENSDGYVSPGELHSGLLSRGYEEDQVAVLFEKLDSNTDGKVSLDEFLDGMMATAARGSPEEGDDQALRLLVHDFIQIDVDKDGFLDSNELFEGLRERGYGQDQISELFGRLDVNKDGKISMHEWLEGMTGGSSFSRLRKAIANSTSDDIKKVRMLCPSLLEFVSSNSFAWHFFCFVCGCHVVGCSYLEF